MGLCSSIPVSESVGLSLGVCVWLYLIVNDPFLPTSRLSLQPVLVFAEDGRELGLTGTLTEMGLGLGEST